MSEYHSTQYKWVYLHTNTRTRTHPYMHNSVSPLLTVAHFNWHRASLKYRRISAQRAHAHAHTHICTLHTHTNEQWTFIYELNFLTVLFFRQMFTNSLDIISTLFLYSPSEWNFVNCLIEMNSHTSNYGMHLLHFSTNEKLSISIHFVFQFQWERIRVIYLNCIGNNRKIQLRRTRRHIARAN